MKDYGAKDNVVGNTFDNSIYGLERTKGISECACCRRAGWHDVLFFLAKPRFDGASWGNYDRAGGFRRRMGRKRVYWQWGRARARSQWCFSGILGKYTSSSIFAAAGGGRGNLSDMYKKK